MIVYHDENNDGIFSASIAYHFLQTEGTNKNNISLLGTKPIRSKIPFIKNPEQYKGKNVLILDLDYNGEYLQLLSRYCNSILVIDDHDKTDQKNSDKIKLFKNRANIHGTVAFFPLMDLSLGSNILPDASIAIVIIAALLYMLL
jgi:oligoribonuclease NrnB/cAMP/cGMP phosphodiesterase (DHH superfamily)